jgi:predicted dehydrogenase
LLCGNIPIIVTADDRTHSALNHPANKISPLRVAVIGCGAVSEFYYAPVLSLLQEASKARVVALFDPEAKRASKLRLAFPEASVLTSLERVTGDDIDLAIVASPPRFHAKQTIELLSRGAAVLCEKPMAATVAEAEHMVEAAERSKRVLAVGLFRRFFPVNQNIRGIIQNQSLGLVKSFEISEGGQFNWPAQSASFFQKSNSQGGVLADLGVHVLDLVIWWFGMPDKVAYEDDAMGGLEANCRLEMKFASGVSGTVRLSRDSQLPNRTLIECERGWVRCKAAAANQLEVGFSGAPFVVGEQLSALDKRGPRSIRARPAFSYHQSFFKQLNNVVAAIREEEPLFIPGNEGVLSLRIIEQSYRHRRLMRLPWLSENELARALALNKEPL